jgi:hypothetical protein
VSPDPRARGVGIRRRGRRPHEWVATVEAVAIATAVTLGVTTALIVAIRPPEWHDLVGAQVTAERVTTIPLRFYSASPPATHKARAMAGRSVAARPSRPVAPRSAAAVSTNVAAAAADTTAVRHEVEPAGAAGIFGPAPSAEAAARLRLLFGSPDSLSPEAKRAQILSQLGAEAAALAPTGTNGSISVGLPGGGPSRAQRKRDSITYAEDLRILHRLQTRADSVKRARADSVKRARTDSVTRAR